ncbi:hypothetical protein [Nitrosopumilus sp.]|uniref:hypothetical protein n=1 Tax=Nitrosopumilus sp. TaxID=2024843 RepID=UPI0029308DA6|nr:hypothetical protein [Nitrosopumilus sp.]
MNKADRFTKTKICHALFFSLLFSPLFFYFVLERPEILEITTTSLFSFWCVSFFLDMKSTLSIKEKIKIHEANHVFRILYTKFNPRIAVMFQLLIEISFVLLFPIISTIREAGQSFEMDWTGSAILGGIVGVLHVIAWWQNKHTIKELDDQKYA